MPDGARLDAVTVVVDAGMVAVHGVTSDPGGHGRILHMTTTTQPRMSQPPDDPRSVTVVSSVLLTVALAFFAYAASVDSVGWRRVLVGVALVFLLTGTAGLTKVLEAARHAVAERKARGGGPTGEAWLLTGQWEKERFLDALTPVRRLDAALAGLREIHATGQPAMVDVAELKAAAAQALAGLATRLSRYRALRDRLAEARATARRPSAARPEMRQDFARVEIELRGKLAHTQQRVEESVADLERMAALAERMVRRWRRISAEHADEKEVQRVLRESWAAVDGDADSLVFANEHHQRADLQSTLAALADMIDTYGRDVHSATTEDSQAIVRE